MKQKYFFYILILFLSIFTSKSAFSADEICGSQTGYQLFKCRAESICEVYKSEKPVYNSESYNKAEDNAWENSEYINDNSPTVELDTVKRIYRKNMGNIYKCAMIQAQINSLDSLTRLMRSENSGLLADSIEQKIQSRQNRLDITANTLGCTLSDNKNINNKINILRETTHQACVYTSYLEYLKDYYDSIENVYRDTREKDPEDPSYQPFKLTPQQISNDLNTRKNAVAEEISHTFSVFPIAYQAYSEYENNFPIHFLLELIKTDYMVLRKNLEDTLYPFAQLWLKPINATMK